jgi:hypothetical protein
MIVPEDEFVPISEAKRALRLRQPWVNILAALGHLTRAATKPSPWYTDDIGVTRDSLEDEIHWWSTASTRDRLRRRVGLVGSLLWHSVSP